MKVEFNREKLYELLVNFFNVAKVRTVIYDEDFNKIIAYPENSCAFCKLIKQNPQSRALCRLNDTNACDICREMNNIYIYRCHAGLFEAAAPIKTNGITIGYIMFGQVIDRDCDKNEISQYAKKYISDTEALKGALTKIVKRSEEQIKSIAKIMEICASHLWVAELIKVDEGNLIYHLSNYINNNIREDLSVEKLCEIFKVSRSRLYEVSHKYFGESIAKYIRRKRVMLAAKLLENENCSVAFAAESAGIYDYNYFSKIFKAEIGMTPTRYKKLKN